MAVRHGARGRVVAVAAVVALAFSVVVLVAPDPVGAIVPFSVRGSVNQVSVTGLTPGDAVELRDSANQVVDLVHHDWDPPADVADAQGAYLFREVPAGDGYTVTSGGQTSGPVTVTDPSTNPPESFYQPPNAPVLSNGFTYIPTRDGTTLSANITFPSDTTTYRPPWPVLVDYSGYDPSTRAGRRARSSSPCMGYVVVGLNMRGTTCSGGAF